MCGTVLNSGNRDDCKACIRNIIRTDLTGDAASGRYRIRNCFAGVG